jgi:hypothetical protein
MVLVTPGTHVNTCKLADVLWQEIRLSAISPIPSRSPPPHAPDIPTPAASHRAPNVHAVSASVASPRPPSGEHQSVLQHGIPMQVYILTVA